MEDWTIFSCHNLIEKLTLKIRINKFIKFCLFIIIESLFTSPITNSYLIYKILYIFM